MTSTGLRAAVFAAAWLIVAVVAASASAQQANPEAKAKPTRTPKPPFSRLAVKPATITFKVINLETGRTVETHNFTISDTGTAPLESITVVPPTGSAAFSVVSAAVPSTLQPKAVATVTVQFQPAKAGTFTGKIAVICAASKGANSVKVQLNGSAKGKLPAATPTLIPTPTPTMGVQPTSTATISPTPPAPTPTPTTGVQPTPTATTSPTPPAPTPTPTAGVQPTPTATASPTPPPNAAAPVVIFVANGASNAIAGYPIGSNGTVSPNFKLSGGSTQFDLPLAVAFDSLGYMYVTNSDSEAISVFAPSNSGNATPIAVISGSDTGLNMPWGIVVDGAGKIYVANYNANSILVFPPLGSGTGNLNEAPVATISGANTGVSIPSGIALDAGGNIYVTSGYNNSVTIFPPIGTRTGNLDESPTATIVGANSGNLTGLGQPSGIAIDVSGKIYVANTASKVNSITVFPALGASVGMLNEAPLATIAGANTSLSDPLGLALAPSGAIFVTNNTPFRAGVQTVTEYPALGNSTGSLNEAPLASINNVSGAEFLTIRPLIFAANSASGAVTAFAAGSNGNLAPSAIIDGTSTGLMGGAPMGVALDASGRIYASSPNLGTIEVFAAGSSGNAASLATIGGATTGLTEAPGNAPIGVALDASGNIYATTTGNSVVIFPPLGNGSGNLDEPPTATISGASTMLNSPAGVTLDAAGKIYVANFNAGVTIYPALGSSAGNLNEAPTATIAGTNTGLGGAKGIALDAAGRIYVTNDQPGASVAVFAPLGSSTGNLNAAPVATISGGNTELSAPVGITIDAIGNIYVGDLNNGILEYAALGSSTGNLNVAPIAAISGGNTGLDQPELLTIAP